MVYRSWFFLIPILFVIGIDAETVAQDTHYWTYQYGMRAELLGGAAVGSVLDVSTMYYNPGGLSLIERTAPFSTTFSFEANTIKIEDGAGKGS